jgi:phosphoglycerate dehydrogenase-like enzyme
VGDAEVLVTWPDYELEGATTGARLRAAGLRPRVAPKTGARSPAELARLAAGAVGAIVSTDPFDETVFAAAPELKVVARVGVGTDSIDLDAATAAGAIVTVTPGANQETAADHALALILAVLRRIVEHDASVRRGEWSRGGTLTPWELHRATVGIVGFGIIGKAVRRRLVGFGVDVLIADPAIDAVDGLSVVALDELLARADVVTLHLPLSDRTRGLIGAAELAAMRPEAVLVNTARGGLVDEAALLAALESGAIRAAALDVFADEPAIPAALLKRPDVTLTPHVSGLSDRSIARMTAEATESVLHVLAGRPDRVTIANPAVLGSPGAVR